MRPYLCVLGENLTILVIKCTFFCGLNSILWRAQIVEVKYQNQQNFQKEYAELGETLILILSMCKPIFGTYKAVVLDIVFCVSRGITKL